MLLSREDEAPAAVDTRPSPSPSLPSYPFSSAPLSEKRLEEAKASRCLISVFDAPALLSSSPTCPSLRPSLPPPTRPSVNASSFSCRYRFPVSSNQYSTAARCLPSVSIVLFRLRRAGGQGSVAGLSGVMKISPSEMRLHARNESGSPDSSALRPLMGSTMWQGLINS